MMQSARQMTYMALTSLCLMARQAWTRNHQPCLRKNGWLLCHHWSKRFRARQKYEEAGASTVHSAFELANILHTDKKVLEASELYRIAFDLHNKRPDHYPLAHSLLQVRLLCLLKAGRRIPDKELSELSKLSIPYANYIGGVDLAWREQLPEEALKLIGNSFEEFHTGEEIDSIYLEIARQVFGSTIGGDSPVGECAIPYKLYMYWDKNPP